MRYCREGWSITKADSNPRPHMPSMPSSAWGSGVSGNWGERLAEEGRRQGGEGTRRRGRGPGCSDRSPARPAAPRSALAPPSTLSSAPLRPPPFPPLLLLLLLPPRPLPELASSDPPGCPPLPLSPCCPGSESSAAAQVGAPGALRVRRAARREVSGVTSRVPGTRELPPDCARSLRQRGRWRCAVSECDLSACASTGVTSVWMGKCVRARNQPTELCP